MINKTIKVVPNGVNTSQFKVMNREKQKTWVAHTFGVDLSPDLNIVTEALECILLTTRSFLVGDGVRNAKACGWCICVT